MASEKNSHRRSSLFQPTEGTKKVSTRHRRLSHLIDKLHSAKALYFISGFCQLLLGIGVLASAALGFIHPLWLSTVLTVAASIGTTLGFYICYSAFRNMHPNQLLRNAMRRIMEDQN